MAILCDERASECNIVITKMTLYYSNLFNKLILQALLFNFLISVTSCFSPFLLGIAGDKVYCISGYFIYNYVLKVNNLHELST